MTGMLDGRAFQRPHARRHLYFSFNIGLPSVNRSLRSYSGEAALTLHRRLRDFYQLIAEKPPRLTSYHAPR